MHSYTSLRSTQYKNGQNSSETMTLSDDFASLYVSFGLNNIVARETRVEPPFPSVDTQSLAGSLTSDPFNPCNPWPAVKKVVSKISLVREAKMARNITEHNGNISLPFSAFQCSNSKLKSLSAKRNTEFPRLARGSSMSTVHHPRMDSPTIPGRFPLHERSWSAPEESTTSLLSGASKSTPIPEPCILFPGRDEDIQAAAAAINDRLMSSAGKTQKPEPPSSLDVSQIPLKRGNDDQDKPPVPPKSPSLATRLATAAQQGGLASKYNPSSSKISLQIDTKVTQAELTKSTGHITSQERRPGNPDPRASTALGFFPPVAKPSQPHKRSESACSHFPKPSLNRKPVPQQEQGTGPSVINRGRPNKRRVPFKSTGVEQVSFVPLPSGFDVVEAKEQLLSSEVDKLHLQARNQAQRFKILKYSDVRQLSLELRVFDERHEYLRNTHQTLRLGRSHLHERMIAFLRSPRSTTNFRDIMLRQEKALAELDHTIDEWYLKLEQVENRRSRVRQILLEHIAGSLMMASSSSSSSPSPSSSAQLRQQTTPPQSPTVPDAEVARESIKIYAESGVYADADIEDLLADIEQQMEEMNSSREQSPSTESAIAA
ncbi:hypothetical protein PISL3812_08908 [Talaromyces islandicus]|uniref:Up-regulated during septation protein 1 domain-containing protein n=1 Tax=Talaromyces islandicus TaxID=28573 RepID=A0A0U1M890_TALIS|nr:hypothetical protein PISL3812_08908 [Talaromyces islandicus]